MSDFLESLIHTIEPFTSTQVSSETVKESLKDCLEAVQSAEKDYRNAQILRTKLLIVMKTRFARRWNLVAEKNERAVVDAFSKLLIRTWNDTRLAPNADGAALEHLVRDGLVSEMVLDHWAGKNYSAVFAELLHFQFPATLDLEILAEIEELLSA